MGQNEVWKIKKRCCFRESMDDEKRNHGFERSIEDKKDNGISKKVWMIKK